MMLTTFSGRRLARLALALAIAGLLCACASPESLQARQRLALMGVTPTPERLVQFAAQGDTTVVELLLAAGLDVNTAEPVRKASALHHAAAGGHVRLVGALLARGANPNAVDWNGNTPLINAAYFGHLDAVKVLLQKGARIDAVSKAGHSALMAAVFHGKENLVSYLLQQGANPALATPDGDTASSIAARAGRGGISAQISQRLAETKGKKP